MHLLIKENQNGAMNKVIYILFLSFILSQTIVETKQFSFYYDNNSGKIDFKDIIKDYNGNYKIELISIDDIYFERTKKIMIEQCDLKFKILNNLSKIDVSRCDNKLTFKGLNYLNNNNSYLNIDHSKYKVLSCTLIFWVTGYFGESQNKDIAGDGVLEEFYETGQLKIKYNFSDGKKNGIQKQWYLNGQLKSLYNYDNSKLSGVQKKWHENGSLKAEWHYENDKLHGITKEWYSNGNIKFSKKYEDGILIEVIENYNLDGKPFN